MSDYWIMRNAEGEGVLLIDEAPDTGIVEAQNGVWLGEIKLLENGTYECYRFSRKPDGSRDEILTHRIFPITDDEFETYREFELFDEETG